MSGSSFCPREGKTSYPSKSDANAATRHARSRGRYVYPCRFCAGFHITSRAPMSRRDVERRQGCYR